MKTMKEKPARKTILACVLAAVVMMSLAFAACGQSPEEGIRKALTEQFDNIKTGADASLNEMIDEFIQETK
ncbi:MAG: hypothetical protein FWG03_00255 [Clostridiales bacterium]|nr:hypothetical protein [Clostridiales bacterium]